MVLEELLEGADGDAGVQGQGFAGLALEVGQQAAAVNAQQVKGLAVAAAEEELVQVVGEGRGQRLDLFGCHGFPSGSIPEDRYANCIPVY